MEKTLRELETIWADMNFDTSLHDSSGENLLVARDELIEQLEGDQVSYEEGIISCDMGWEADPCNNASSTCYGQSEVSEWKNYELLVTFEP